MSIEASSVMALRTLRIAAGGKAADAESRLMVDEKIKAALALQAMAASGGLGPTALSAATRTLALYLPKVKANPRRLSKPR